MNTYKYKLLVDQKKFFYLFHKVKYSEHDYPRVFSAVKMCKSNKSLDDVTLFKDTPIFKT